MDSPLRMIRQPDLQHSLKLRISLPVRWQITNKGSRPLFRSLAYTDSVYCLSFNPDGKRLATGRMEMFVKPSDFQIPSKKLPL